jgi:glyoxylase-like metal-dependent hydrolase (beta-lactamase superfamily II)
VISSLLPEDILVFERGWLSSNNVLLDDGHKSWLIDSGYCTHSDQLLSLIEHKLGNRQLDYLINTHLHSDHCGGNAALQEKYPLATTLIPPGQAAFVKNWNPDALTYVATGQLCPRFAFNQVLEPGTSMRLGSSVWDIHAAPGHDPDAILLFEPISRTLISGDALWENGFGIAFPELEGINAFDEVAATLDLIENLAPKTVIPGHGRVFDYTIDTLCVARQRLEAFVRNPSKHARHAVKVLLKFKLLEVQQQLLVDFQQWAESTPYLHICRQRYFKEMDFSPFFEQMCAELISSKAASVADGVIYNS